MRTGHPSLRVYLFSRRVPGITTPWCRCAESRETPRHILLGCEPEEEERPGIIKDLRSKQDIEDALEDPAASREIVRWLMTTGRIKEFDLARRLGANN